MFRRLFDENHDRHPQEGGIWGFVSLLAAAAFIFIVCLLFHQYCEPAPSMFEQVVFYAIIFLIFLETVYAGFYRSEE